MKTFFNLAYVLVHSTACCFRVDRHMSAASLSFDLGIDLSFKTKTVSKTAFCPQNLPNMYVSKNLGTEKTPEVIDSN